MCLLSYVYLASQIVNSKEGRVLFVLFMPQVWCPVLAGCLISQDGQLEHYPSGDAQDTDTAFPLMPPPVSGPGPRRCSGNWRKEGSEGPEPPAATEWWCTEGDAVERL